MQNIKIDNISTSYYITADGKCYNNTTNKFLKGQVGKHGYLTYNLTLPTGRKKRVYAHRLVGEAFLHKQSLKHNQINHKDGNKLNNHIDNLEWVTPQENQQHALENELRQYAHVFCFNKNKKLIAEYNNVAVASKATGISKSIIFQELNKEIKTLSGGFYWSRTNILDKTIDYPNLGKAKKVNQYTLDGKYIFTYPSVGTAARALGLKKGSHIGECCRGKIKSYKNFIWRYVDDIVSPLSEN